LGFNSLQPNSFQRPPANAWASGAPEISPIGPTRVDSPGARRLVDLIQDDFPRTPSPVFAAMRQAEMAAETAAASNGQRSDEFFNSNLSFLDSREDLRQPTPRYENIAY
jgi:hypothetical protein